MSITDGLIHPAPAGFVGSKRHYQRGIIDRLEAELKQLRGTGKVRRPKQCPLHDISHRQGWHSVTPLDIEVLKARELGLTAAQCRQRIRQSLNQPGGTTCPQS